MSRVGFADNRKCRKPLIQINVKETFVADHIKPILKDATMPEQSSMHSQLSWTKERIDEMDWTPILASLESRTRQLKADFKEKADPLIADMKKRRDDFQAHAKAQAEAGEAAWHAAKAQLDAQWHGFEPPVKTCSEDVGEELEQKQATFREVTRPKRRPGRIRLKSFMLRRGRSQQADEAEARLQKLKQAGTKSWTALSAALAE